jgi:lipopolysaccharide transport system ATP-binding protein
MTNDIAIKVHCLSKKFTLKVPIPNGKGVQSREIWALNNISFELKKGEALGVIGSNGSGKSTLLKALSRIIKPTSGKIEIDGRIAAILDIGTGFHPDLSGKENIFLSGMLIGMTRQEVAARYEEIVEFSGIENFIDVPVKFYSSGMYIRLAFSIVAFLDSDIMIFDEVISVGDAAFTIKCKNKIDDLIRTGHTLIIASHNMNDMMNYCANTIHLEKGSIVSSGETGSEVTNYLGDVYDKYQEVKSKIEGHGSSHRYPSVMEWDDKNKAPGNEYFSLIRFSIYTKRQQEEAVFFLDEEIFIELEYQAKELNQQNRISLALRTLDGTPVFASVSYNEPFQADGNRKHRLTCIIPGNLLNQGVFALNFNYIGKDRLFKIPLSVSFKAIVREDPNLVPEGFFGSIKPKLEWQFNYNE